MKTYIDTNKQIHSLEDDGSQDFLVQSDWISITQAEIDAVNKAKEDDRIPNLTYAEKREAAYPSLAQQMDMQYHDLINGTTVWKDTIEAIKAKYPKS